MTNEDKTILKDLLDLEDQSGLISNFEININTNVYQLQKDINNWLNNKYYISMNIVHMFISMVCYVQGLNIADICRDLRICRAFFSSQRAINFIKQIGLVDTDFVIYSDNTTLCSYVGKNETVYIPNNIIKIDDYAFWDKEVCEIHLGNNVKTIGKLAFSNCTFLNILKLNDCLEKIDEFAFSDSSIDELYIPSTIKHIHVNAFAASNIKLITFSKQTLPDIVKSTKIMNPTIDIRVK